MPEAWEAEGSARSHRCLLTLGSWLQNGIFSGAGLQLITWDWRKPRPLQRTTAQKMEAVERCDSSQASTERTFASLH